VNVKSFVARDRSPLEAEVFSLFGANPAVPVYLHIYVSNLNGGTADVCADYWLNLYMTAALTDLVEDAA